EQQQIFLGRDFAQEERNYSERSAQRIDEEVRQLLDEANAEAMQILQDHRNCLEKVTEVLLEKEVIQGSELEALIKEELGEEFKVLGAGPPPGSTEPAPPLTTEIPSVATRASQDSPKD